MKRNVLLIVALVITIIGLLGCQKETPMETPVASEPASSSEEVIEEVASEEETEEFSETTKEVEVVNFSSYKELREHIKERNEVAIVESALYKEGSSQYIIPNGASYTMQLTSLLHIYPHKEATLIVSNVKDVVITESVEENAWTAWIRNKDTDIEFFATIKYTDGTKENILLYVTNTFD